MMKVPYLLKGEKWQWMWSKDWILRFISLVLAIGLWAMVGGEDKVHKNVMIPIEIINLPRDLVISNQFKKQIEVTVNGPRSLILEMGKKEITRQVDLSHATPGTNVIPNEIDSVAVPRGVKVERIQPSTIILSLDKLVQKHFSILPVLLGKVPSDYLLGEVTTDPGEIAITGPATVLEKFDALPTHPINVKGLKEPVQLQVPLDLSPAVVGLIGETSVTAHIQISLKTVEKVIKKVPVRVEKDGVVRDVIPATVTITAEVPRLLVQQKVDLKTLFDAGVVGESGADRLEVKVVPKASIEPEIRNAIKVLQVVPFFVTLKEQIVEDKIYRLESIP